MDINQYQYEASLTALDTAECPEYLIPGLAAEAGEVAGKYAKYVRDDTRYNDLRDDLFKELGDVLWFVAMLCEQYDFDMADVAEANIKKLNSRKQRGTLKGSGDDR